MGEIDRGMFRFIWRYSRRDQLAILAVVLLSLPFYFLALDLPKTIVNGAIQGEGFEGGGARTVLDITIPALFGGEAIPLFDGVALERLPFLVWTSLLFLLLVIVNGLFKYRINTAKGRLGERMLRRLRYMLFERILRFPPEAFGGMRASELSTMIKDEVEPLGGFIGDAYVQPVFLGGQVATALAFIFLQNVWLGAVAGSIALAQALLIPRLRTPILTLGRERQLTARALAGRIGDAVDGIAEIHVNGTARYEGAAIGGLLGHIFAIRFRLYRKKFLVKFVNNLLAQMTPFLFFLVGGYFVIAGQLDVGQLVAVIVAYKELPGPMKELIDWDLRRLDGGIKYEQVVSQFAVARPAPPVTEEGAADAGLGASVEITDLVLTDAPLSLTLPMDENTVLDGPDAAPLLEALARLRSPASGAIRFGGRSPVDIPAGVATRSIGYVGEAASMRGDTVFDVLAYGLLHAAPPAQEASAVAEARRTGNPVHPAGGDWIDYVRAGVGDREALKTAMIAVLDIVEARAELYSWGLRQPVDGAVDGPRLMRARRSLAASLCHPDYAGYVEHFDAAAYNRNASIGENIVFGAVLDTRFGPEGLATDAHMMRVLKAVGIQDMLLATGREIGTMMVEIFADLSPDSPLVEQFSFVSGADLPQLDALLKRRVMTGADRARLLALAFRYCEIRHRFDLMTPDLERGVLEARALFRSALPDAARGSVGFYDPDRPTTGAVLIDDILFGRIAATVADARDRVEALVRDVLEEEGLLSVVLESGLVCRVGNAGRYLTPSQRQRLAVARAVLRRPDLLLLNRSLAMIGADQEKRIVTRIARHRKGKGMIVNLGGNTSPDDFGGPVTVGNARVGANGKVRQPWG